MFQGFVLLKETLSILYKLDYNFLNTLGIIVQIVIFGIFLSIFGFDFGFIF